MVAVEVVAGKARQTRRPRVVAVPEAVATEAYAMRSKMERQIPVAVEVGQVQTSLARVGMAAQVL